MNILINRFVRSNSFNWLVSRNTAVRICAAVIAGTAIAFLLCLFFPLVKSDKEILKTYVKESMPLHTVAMTIVLGVSLLAILVFTVSVRLWRSLKLGLIPLPSFVWVVSVVASWLLVKVGTVLKTRTGFDPARCTLRV
jgi:hypothetical protein